MWLALKLLASGAFERLMKGLSAVWKWIISDWRNGPLLWFVLLFLANAFWVIPSLRSQVTSLTAERDAEQAAHLGTVNAFLEASKQAQREAEANARRVTAEQEQITDATLSDLAADHAALGARFDRLRARHAAAVGPGRADAAGLPAAGATPGRAAAAAPDHDLRPTRTGAGDLTPQPLCPAALVCLTIDQAEAASEDAHRHNALIDWITAQSAVRFTPEVAAE